LFNSKLNKNALIHGVYSDCVVLEGESPEDFSNLWEGFRIEYSPQDASEEAAVFDLASLHWKKRRLEAGLQRALNMQRASSNTAADASGDSWDRVADEARSAAKSQLTAAQILCGQIFKTMERVVSKPDQTIDDSEATEIEQLTVLTQQLNFVSKDLILPILFAAEKQKQDEIERAYNPDIMERELKIQSEIDRRIEKVLKRLITIKEYKRMYVAKSVYSKPVQIEALSPKPIEVKADPGG
jgi:hypothetical protein